MKNVLIIFTLLVLAGCSNSKERVERVENDQISEGYSIQVLEKNQDTVRNFVLSALPLSYEDIKSLWPDDMILTVKKQNITVGFRYEVTLLLLPKTKEFEDMNTFCVISGKYIVRYSARSEMSFAFHQSYLPDLLNFLSSTSYVDDWDVYDKLTGKILATGEGTCVDTGYLYILDKNANEEYCRVFPCGG